MSLKIVGELRIGGRASALVSCDIKTPIKAPSKSGEERSTPGIDISESTKAEASEIVPSGVAKKNMPSA